MDLTIQDGLNTELLCGGRIDSEAKFILIHNYACKTANQIDPRLDKTHCLECEQNNDHSEDHSLNQSMDLLYGPLRELTIRNENEAYCYSINSKRDSDKFWRQFSHISPRGGNFR